MRWSETPRAAPVDSSEGVKPMLVPGCVITKAKVGASARECLDAGLARSHPMVAARTDASSSH